MVDLIGESRLVPLDQLLEVVEGLDRSQNLGDALVEKGLIDSETLGILLSTHLRIPFVNLKKQIAEPAAVDLIPEWMSRKYNFIPLRVTNHALTVAMEDPGDLNAIDELAAWTKKQIEPVLALNEDIQEAISISYRVGEEIERQLNQIPMNQQRSDYAYDDTLALEQAIDQAPVVKAIDLLIRQGARDRASDIHIEPQEGSVRIRYRIDGILHEMMSLPTNVHSALLSRIKIMAGLNIAERRRPQDGQISFKDGDRDLDIRVATSNTIHGEMAVLRLLDKTFALLSLPQLGFQPETLKQYATMLKSPFGMILISGPTGSGKTTTLYASVNQLDSIGRNILTIEDPVEYRFENINQTQVNPAAGLTFANGLRAAMRLDPDIILVGEIRDNETAQIAIQSALTGHLVLSSIHANDTAGVIFRLIDLGVEPFLVASATIGVVAQRMVRVVCPNCSRQSRVTTEERLAFEQEMGESTDSFAQGAGCNFCARTGYYGRTCIYEVMVLSESIRRLIFSGGSTDEIRATAQKEGLITLWHDGMMKVKQGMTTPYEIIRTVFSAA